MTTNILTNLSKRQDEQNISWIDAQEEGQLAIDVYETIDYLVIKSTIAGVDPKNLDISVNHDMLTIRGKREEEHMDEEPTYFFRECYWGNFSRSIILPFDIDEKNIEASLENGILTIKLPKSKNISKKIEIKVNN